MFDILLQYRSVSVFTSHFFLWQGMRSGELYTLYEQFLVVVSGCILMCERRRVQPASSAPFIELAWGEP